MIKAAMTTMVICTPGRIMTERRRRGSLELLRRRVYVFLLRIFSSLNFRNG